MTTDIGKTSLAIGLTLVIMHLGAFVAYGGFALFWGLEPPQEVSPARMFVAVFVMKLGLAIGFVLLYRVARESWAGRWPIYALIWWVMLAVTEVGQAIGPNYSWAEAAAGIIAEMIYCPASAFVTARLLGARSAGAP